jgi:hypothetical protein
MMYKINVAVCSEIRTKHINVMSLQCRLFNVKTRCYVKYPLGFRSFTNFSPRYHFIRQSFKLSLLTLTLTRLNFNYITFELQKV